MISLYHLGVFINAINDLVIVKSQRSQHIRSCESVQIKVEVVWTMRGVTHP